MKVLILSSSTGGGHNAAAAAVTEACIQAGHEAVMLDVFSLASENTAHRVGQCYVQLAKNMPYLFGCFYYVAKMISSSRRKSPVYYLNGLMAKKLGTYLSTHSYDAIVMSHLFPMEIITFLKRRHRKLPLCIGVFTDYTCIPFIEETSCDYYILPHPDLTDECIVRGIPSEKLISLGIPVKSSFCKKIEQAEAKQKLHLPPDKPMYLIISGSMGFGKTYLFVFELIKGLQNEEQVVIICGSNNHLKNTLQLQFSNHENIHIVGYTDHVADFMAACDVIYTKPGGLTSTEALAMNIPIVHTPPIPGCENKNRDFFVTRGMSIAANRIQKQIKLGRMLIENNEVRNAMLSAQRKNARPMAAKMLVQFLEEKLRERNL